MRQRTCSLIDEKAEIARDPAIPSENAFPYGELIKYLWQNHHLRYIRVRRTLSYT